MTNKTKILAIDDQEEVLYVVKCALEGALDCQVQTEQDPLRGSELIGVGEYDLLITDIHMPGMNGLDFITKVRGLGFDKPILVLTGTEPSFEGFADDNLHLKMKPINFPRLIERVKSLL